MKNESTNIFEIEKTLEAWFAHNSDCCICSEMSSWFEVADSWFIVLDRMPSVGAGVFSISVVISVKEKKGNCHINLCYFYDL